MSEKIADFSLNHAGTTYTRNEAGQVVSYLNFEGEVSAYGGVYGTMKVVEELDAGPVMHQAKIAINENTDTQTLTQVLSQLGAKALLDSISKIENGKAKFKEQNHNQATYAKKISKTEGKIEWNESAKKVLAKINGVNPNPGAWFEYKNERYKIWKAEIVNKSGKIGTILNDQLLVSCKDQAIQILEIQKEGKSRQATKQFLLGNKINQGENIA